VSGRIVVLVTNYPGCTEVIFTHNGNFSHGLNEANTKEILEWCADQFANLLESAWELYESPSYLFLRVPPNSDAGMHAKIRWHGVADPV
jgi:hypothetical protein